MKYTVILLRPDYVADRSVYADTYLVHVTAEDVDVATQEAQDQAYAADGGDDIVGNPADYAALFVFEGHLISLGGGR